jgi:hypothetical protein
MLISRCAWHRRYYGYTKILGINSWRGLQPNFTDGICQNCAARVRADHLRARFGRRAFAGRRDGAWVPGLAAVSLGIIVALVLIARPTHEPPPPPAAGALAPATVTDGAAPEPAAPMRLASGHRLTRPERSARRPAIHWPLRAAWYPSGLPRVSVPVSWSTARHHAVGARDNHQSP